MSNCRNCGNPIRFVTITTTNRPMPVDPHPDPDGNVTAARTIGGRWVGHVLKAGEEPAPGYARYMPHKATCVFEIQSKAYDRIHSPTPPPPPPTLPGLDGL